MPNYDKFFKRFPQKYFNSRFVKYELTGQIHHTQFGYKGGNNDLKQLSDDKRVMNRSAVPYRVIDDKLSPYQYPEL
jgi:hypothetical protein